jgi:hypothetical protein
MSVEPDAEGFRLVQSRRHWRRIAEPHRPVPSNLVGKCFNCLAGDHIKADCKFPSKCFNCKDGGHQAHDCPLPPVAGPWEGKQGRSPGRIPSASGVSSTSLFTKPRFTGGHSICAFGVNWHNVIRPASL